MHLLSAKATTKNMAQKHSYFKRKSLKSTVNSYTLTNCNLVNANAATAVDTGGIEKIVELRTRTTSVGSSGGCAGGVGGNLAKASKLKLKMGFNKTNKRMKWTQKFHWLQNYVKSADARTDLCKPTTTIATTAAATTTTTNSKHLNGFSKTSENVVNCCTTAIASKPKDIVVVDNDYYSSICDNQLSFNNSPCKRFITIVDDINHLNYNRQKLHAPLNFFGDVVDGANNTNTLLDDNNEVSSIRLRTNDVGVNDNDNHNDNDDDFVDKVVVVRPTNKQCVGFNITVSSNGSGSSSSGYATATTTTTNSSNTIYDTPLTSKQTDEVSPFIFPSISDEITDLAQVLQTTNIKSGDIKISNGNVKAQQQQQHQHPQ